MSEESILAGLMKAIQIALDNTGAKLDSISRSDIAADIPGLESDDWPYIETNVGEILEINIPENVHLFTEGHSKNGKKRTIGQIVDIILKLSELEKK
ncbi:MAG TPA: hypothetical protein VK171_14020 [Fimbriimonas sp.]|nr:hypothetical protein [Fimbriimonas sp.]